MASDGMKSCKALCLVANYALQMIGVPVRKSRIIKTAHISVHTWGLLKFPYLLVYLQSSNLHIISRGYSEQIYN